MEASIHKKKCGVKRKNHKCGIGLCNADEEEEYEPPVKIANLGKLQAGEAKPKNHVQRRCRKCLMPLKSHPLPRGEGCMIISKLADDEKVGIIKKQQQLTTEKNLSRKREERKGKSNEQIEIDRESSKIRMASTTNKEGTRKRMASEANKEHTRKRLASTENKEGTRKRMASTSNKEATRKRLATKTGKEGTKKRMASDRNKQKNKERKKIDFLKAKKRSRSEAYVGWCDPKSFEKQKIPVLSLPKMEEECVDCKSLMFPFENKRKKGDGFSFSLCCEYGK